MIIVVIGVAGSGKTTVGTMLAGAMKCPFLEGDSLHPQENIDKMSHGIPLTDSDRGPWLSAIHARMLDYFERGQDLIVGCSALKQEYRRVLAKGIPITWVYLKGSPALIRSRLRHRSPRASRTAAPRPTRFACAWPRPGPRSVWSRSVCARSFR